MKEKILELYEECLEKAKSKEKFHDLEILAIGYARKLNQALMQGVINSKGTGKIGKTITLDDGNNVEFKEYIKKKS